MEDIFKEAEFLAQNGVKEITLLGQIVNNYGAKKMPTVSEKTPFVQLLRRLNSLSGIERIRRMSPHPKFFPDDLIWVHGNLPKLYPSIHLPIQSRSNPILAAMKCRYSREKILEIVEKLRIASPGMGITTDIIVGYPGETEKEFEETVSLLDIVKFNIALIFKSSPQIGTKSTELVDDVRNDEKERRNQILLQRAEEISLHYNQQCLDKRLKFSLRVVLGVEQI
jgi:tRNA-2-methylthio-N6-dimethylallyladenosine synthase